MPDVVDIITKSMSDDLTRLRSVSQNLANVNTTGYKREVVSTESFETVMNKTTTLQHPRLEITRDTTQAVLKKTGNPFDLAVEGDHYLSVESGANKLYTKNGQLQLDGSGFLSLLGGQKVLGIGGGYIQLNPGAFTISANGTVKQDGNEVGQLEIVELSPEMNVDYLGEGLFASSSNPVSANPDDVRILQGYREGSNVNIMDEMVRMIEISRHFETSQNVLQGYDDILDSAINVLGDL